MKERDHATLRKPRSGISPEMHVGAVTANPLPDGIKDSCVDAGWRDVQVEADALKS
jgi:hypothetical protein